MIKGFVGFEMMFRLGNSTANTPFKNPKKGIFVNIPPLYGTKTLKKHPITIIIYRSLLQ